MPPQRKITTKSNIPVQELVPRGSQSLTGTSSVEARDAALVKPTTSRALTLRNGQHGIQRTGEIVLIQKISGREKLDLLAEDIIKQSKTALLAPFNLEECLKIAESQFHAFVDDISDLQDHELFKSLIDAELAARTPHDQLLDVIKQPSLVAGIVGTRIHNSYMLASAWKIVSDSLKELSKEGLADGAIKMHLANNKSMRNRYLALFDMVNTLVDISQSNFSVLATTAPHYSHYFKRVPTTTGGMDFTFDWGNKLRDATLSFLDSIIIELCFPRSPYPKFVLYQLLRDAMQESPKAGKRFPQLLWDAVGELSVCVELQQALAIPLLGPEAEQWMREPREMSERYKKWVDMQSLSEKASSETHNFESLIFPLSKTLDKEVLENMWKCIISNYKTIAGDDLDSLWGLQGALHYAPQWHPLPSIAEFSEGQSSSQSMAMVAVKGGYSDHEDDDSDGSMPDLKNESDSSDSSGEESDEYNDGYDTDDEEELRDMFRNAMAFAHETDWIDVPGHPPDDNPVARADHKGNPFLSLLASLRGRMFSSDPKLKVEMPKTASKRTQYSLPDDILSIVVGSSIPYPEDGKDLRTTDEVLPSPQKKKKKKKPKKKKKQSDSSEVQNGPPASVKADSKPESPTDSPSVVSPTLPETPKSPTTQAQADASRARAPSLMASTISLPISETSTAQSARSYLKSEKLDQEKVKIKSRSDHATIFSKPKKKDTSGKQGEYSKQEGQPAGANKSSWFANLSKKTTEYMRQLLRPAEDSSEALAPMRWEHFLKVMREMGFQYDPSTAGSRVRFDPPNKRDKSITFHKPHPDSTISPVRLKQFAKQLKRYYGWTEEEFLKHASQG